MKRRREKPSYKCITTIQESERAYQKAMDIVGSLSDTCESIGEILLTVELLNKIMDDFKRMEGITDVKIQRCPI